MNRVAQSFSHPRTVIDGPGQAEWRTRLVLRLRGPPPGRKPSRCERLLLVPASGRDRHAGFVAGRANLPAILPRLKPGLLLWAFRGRPRPVCDPTVNRLGENPETPGFSWHSRVLSGRGYGGWGGIRTHEGLAPLPVFKTGAFDRSATHPQPDIISPETAFQGGNADGANSTQAASWPIASLLCYRAPDAAPKPGRLASERRRRRHAGVAELVDARGLGPRGSGRGGSNPFARTSARAARVHSPAERPSTRRNAT